MSGMSKTTFHVLYDGPALINNEMDVRELSPALLSLGQLLEQANTTLNVGRANVAVRVKASFQTGCFGIELDVVQTLVQQVQILFSADNVANAKEILEWIGLLAGPATGLFALLKWLRGRSPQRVVLLDNGSFRVELEGARITVEKQVIELYRNAELRRSIEGVLKPLKTEGINEFAVTNKTQSEKLFRVSLPDLACFSAPETLPEILSEEEIELSLQLVNVVFREDNKWRFCDGSNSFYAHVQDSAFLAKVKSNEPFTSGDILKARMRRTQSLSGEIMRTEYVLLKVLEHRKAESQLPMVFVHETATGSEMPVL
jgi:hypothetical protein